MFLVFYFLLYLYYHNARTKKQEPKGEIIVKTVKKIEMFLAEYYETFKH